MRPWIPNKGKRLRVGRKRARLGLLFRGLRMDIAPSALRALLNIARDTGHGDAVPSTRAEWGALAQKVGIKAIHIAERDTQVSQHRPVH